MVEVFARGPAVHKGECLSAESMERTPEPRFINTVLEALGSLGVSRYRIHRESY